MTIFCFTVANAQQSQPTVNVGIMLPLHDINGDGKRMIEYYRGVLMAVEKLKSEGYNINVRAWNVPEEADIRTTLLDDGAKTCHYIFGPLYTKQVKPLSDFCRNYNIRMVIPFSISGNDVDTNPMIFQIYQSNQDIENTSIQQITDHFSNCHPVFIDCNDSTSNKGRFTMSLRNALSTRNINYNLTSLRSTDDDFAKAFSLSQPNLVILNTGRSRDLTAALNKLDILTERNKGVQVTLFGYTEWLMYEYVNRGRFSVYNTFIPSHFYYNHNAAATQEFEQKYRWRFHQSLQYALPRFALTGYDHAMFFLSQGKTYIQTPLRFIQQNGGGLRNKAYILVHYKTDGSIETICN